MGCNGHRKMISMSLERANSEFSEQSFTYREHISIWLDMLCFYRGGILLIKSKILVAHET